MIITDYEKYMKNVKRLISTQDGQHISEYAKKIVDEMYEVEMGRQTLDEFAARVTEVEDAPTLNYLRERIIDCYPD